MKEVDPQVNWAALVDEKLVRPRLPPCAGRTLPSHGYHSPASWRVMFLMLPDGCVSEDSKAQRGVAPSPVSPSRRGGDWDPPGIALQPWLVGSRQARRSGPVSFLCPHQPVSPMEKGSCWSQLSSLSGVTWASDSPDLASVSPSVKWK